MAAIRDKLTNRQHFEVYRLIGRASQRERLSFAQQCLYLLLEDGISYADFQSAQHTEKAIRKANNAVKGISC